MHLFFYRNNDTLFKKYYKIFNKCKEYLFNAIKQGMDNKNDDYYVTLNNYKDFYNQIVLIRSLKERHSFPTKPPVNIFTTNYDLFNELAMELIDIQYTSGFKGEIDRTFGMENFRFRIVDDENRYKGRWNPYNAYMKLYKIHGSLNWNFNKKNIIELL